MPLPTRARKPRALAGSWLIFTNRGGWVEPRFTPRSPPSFAFSMAALSRTSIVRPAAAAACSARSANTVGVSEPPGSFTRSRARLTAAATCTPFSRAAATVLPPLAATTTSVS